MGKGQAALRLRHKQPEALAKARSDLWDDSPLWGKLSAQHDFHDVFLAEHPGESNTFVLKSRPFPGVGGWKSLGNFPAHYYDHILLCNYMHAWCRDLLELGLWEMLDCLGGTTTGHEVRENATRMMRYLSRLRKEFILAVAEHRLAFGDEEFPLSYRIPTMDLHLLVLYHDCPFSAAGQGHRSFNFDQDPLSLGNSLYYP
jgi:hypothetical protein